MLKVRCGLDLELCSSDTFFPFDVSILLRTRNSFLSHLTLYITLREKFMKPHKNLNAWIKSFELVKVLYGVTNSFPTEERFGLISQIRRAAVSVPVNIAEGSARKGKKEFIHFLHISLGSLTELDTLVLLSRDLKFIPEEKTTLLVNELDTIGKLIYGLIRKLEAEM